jgi:hypothetical protein
MTVKTNHLIIKIKNYQLFINSIYPKIYLFFKTLLKPVKNIVNIYEN